ncbi:MAG TPA: DUF5615 family PIN-like protein [Longimicrobiaceae bacterium]|nr:DUF5615 family PIN-like protein [Longimicrobiaceae bacterium]
MIQLLIDECLTPKLVDVANRFGYLAFHVLHRGWKGNADQVLLGRLRQEGLTLVTNNWQDFRPLLRREEIHAGAIVLPNVPRAEQIEALERALRAIQSVAPPLDMINTVVEVDTWGEARIYEMP